MGHSVSKFRSLPLTSYAANPLAILHVRQSGASTLTVTDDRGAVIFHLDGPPTCSCRSFTFITTMATTTTRTKTKTKTSRYHLDRDLARLPLRPSLFLSRTTDTRPMATVTATVMFLLRWWTMHTRSPRLAAPPLGHPQPVSHATPIHPSCPPLPSRSSASMTTSASNSTAQTHRLAALWTHDPTLCMHVEATKLNLHSHSVTLAVSCPRNGTLFVKAATDAPVTFIFSGHPSHGGLLVARAYRMPPTAADLARSSSFTGGGGSSASTTAASLHRHATPHPHAPPTSSPPTTSKQVKPPPTLSRSADLFSVDIAPGVDQAGIVALCVIAEALRAHLVATHLAHHPRHRDGGGMEGPQRHAHAPHASPMMPASPRFAGSLLRPTALTRSNSVPFDSLAGVLGEPPALSTSAPPPMMDAGAGGYVSPLVARLKAEELGTSSRQSSDQGLKYLRNSNPGPIRWAADMFRHRDKKKKGKDKDKDKDKNAHEGGSNGSLDSSQKVGKSHGSLVSAGS
ncbi:hypothetical protein BCR44DRAFT_1444950 [Catenaria anguillulae PL171]|uniref:Uncharacterized protein n=1 Tax=Catenaria anguillulae PL171 TaxID=765915 RepID=A0A1Y2H8Q8_9FUNG|nr:hypothetical protein BCR44DRAFT_1444950 [Catenaria anguillulae PL171]